MNAINAAGNFHLGNSSSVRLQDKLNSAEISLEDRQKLKDVCRDFEAVFIKKMLDSMRKTVSRSELTKQNMGGEIFEDMLYSKYAEKMSDTAGLGIGDMMFRQLSRQLPAEML